MTDTQPTNSASAQTTATAMSWLSRWLYPILRIAFLVFAAWLIWYTAGHWDRWTGAARFESTDDAFVSGDVTPLSAHVSGYITEMPVNDFQTVRKGDLIAVIDPSDYQAQLDLAQANLAAAQATLATDYFDLRAEDSLERLLQDTVAAYQHALQIVQNQHAAGTVSSADVVTAQAQLESARAQLVGVGVQRAQFEHAIAVLTGHPPAELTIPPALLTSNVPVMPPGLPSTLLQRRPDIAAAERQMQEENALIGVQVAAYYPDISLSAFGGFAGSQLSQLFNVADRIWSLGAATSETLFNRKPPVSVSRGGAATVTCCPGGA